MDLRRSLGRERGYQDDNLNITPIMNIFLILIPFLLLTAVFVRISILEFSLPTAEQARKPAQQKRHVVTILKITESGFELKTEGDKAFTTIARRQEGFDYNGLVEQLSGVKDLHPETEDIILAPESRIKYETLIKVMDSCRENGFLNISISAV